MVEKQLKSEGYQGHAIVFTKVNNMQVNANIINEEDGRHINPNIQLSGFTKQEAFDIAKKYINKR